ncbi:MAG: SdpI family protein [Oscillospiraceae bacterium]|nr:SdpI family protein [Oscillospiraceae bacterium]
MEKITELLNNFSLEKYIPKLDTLMGWIQWLVSLAVRLGPICILVLGIIYFLIPPKEANRKAGFRTYFGMGSVIAWNVTQRLAGILMIPTGLVLTIIAYVKVGKFPDYDLMTMADVAFQAVKGQAICALIIYVLMFLLTAVLFNRNGDCRFGDRVNEMLHKLVPKKVLDEVYVKEPVSAQPEELPQEEVISEEPYEKQGEQVITADDIVIEDLE